MDCSVVEFVGKELGQHGSNIYFKEFSVIVDGVRRSYKLGEFYFMRKDPQQPICIAEFQLIWVNLKDGRKLAAAKLYFRPEDTNSGRLCEHGEDELMEADRFVSVYCEQVPSWEYNSRVPFGSCAYDGVKLANQYINQHNELSSSVNCCCKVTDNCKTQGVRTPVKVLSFPAYCRYRASMKLLATGCKLPRNVMLARGAIEVDCPKTRILFNRFKFQHPNIERFSLAEDIRIPQFKGRPRKRKQSKTKATNDAKKTRVEKENSIPESRNILQMSPKEELKPGRNPTYRIIAPPVDSNPDRNVIHVKIENKNDPGNSKGIKEEIEYSKVDELDNDFERSSMEAESASPDEDDDYKLAMFGDSKFFSDEMAANEEEMEMRRTRSVKREDSDEAPPSELVKNGKTGTILDEAFFREMKNGIIAGEGVDKEKMIKILVDACKDQENFKRELFVFMKQRGTPIVYVPKVGYTRVDLPKLFSLVVSNGGYTQVTLNHKWKKVYDEMALATTITSAATCMRRHYEKLLLPFEKHLRVKHKQDALANKTYSITAQASQPLVLTIKKVKKESPVSPSESPDDSLYLSAHEADIIRSPTSINCRHVETSQELISKSEIFHANNNANIKASTTLPMAVSPKEEHARNMDDRKFERTKLQQGQYPATFKIEPGSGETAKCMSNPDIAKSDGSSQNHHATNTTSTTVCAIPLYKVSEHAFSLRKNAHTTSINAKTILPKQSSFVIPVVSAVPGANANVTVSSFVPSVSSTTMNYHPLHGNEVTVITKARPVENFGPLSVSSALQNINLQNQSQPVFKKRRGRPPKHAKAQMQLLASSVQKSELGYFEKSPNKNGTVIHNYSPHVGGDVPRSMHVMIKARLITQG
ncbi:uncharacterized protein LOC135685682 [Rhopilema esculentum]|uniref:uncharacterized protein LOC135685682 n=1 Tax=Rhopilema esculentum TaxID=499914 RepID=UPI0031DD97F6